MILKFPFTWLNTPISKIIIFWLLINRYFSCHVQNYFLHAKANIYRYLNQSGILKNTLFLYLKNPKTLREQRKRIGAFSSSVITHTWPFFLSSYQLINHYVAFIHKNILHCVEVVLHKLNQLIVIDQFSCYPFYRLNKIWVKNYNFRMNFSHIKKKILTKNNKNENIIGLST